MSKLMTEEFENVNKLAAKRPNTASKAYDNIQRKLTEQKLRTALRKQQKNPDININEEMRRPLTARDFYQSSDSESDESNDNESKSEESDEAMSYSPTRK